MKNLHNLHESGLKKINQISKDKTELHADQGYLPLRINYFLKEIISKTLNKQVSFN